MEEVGVDMVDGEDMEAVVMEVGVMDTVSTSLK
jgi:hypothetical protein